MKKFIAGVMGFLMMGMIIVEADAASRVSSSPSRSSSFSSSRSSSYSSPSRSTYSAPKSYAAPKAAYSAPSSSNPGLKSLGFSRPASAPAVSRPSASVSSSRPTSTVSSGWFGKKSVSSTLAPTYRVPVRQVSSPSAYRSNRSVYSSPRTTVIKRNYYNSYGGYNGYNRNYGGYGGSHYGYYGGSGSSFLYGAAGAFGGLMIYSVNSGATAAQIEQAKTDQRIEDKLDMQNQLLMQRPQTVAAPVVQQPQCYLPPDATLMMNPQFYCGVQNAK